MLRISTFKVLGSIIAVYLLVLAPALIWPSYLDSPVGLLLLIPFSSVHVLSKLGVPGVLEHNGYCGWGICSPTPFGWFLAGALGLLVMWAVSPLIAWLMLRLRR